MHPDVARDSMPFMVTANSSGQLIVVVNGPGETAGWLQPLVAAVRRRVPGVRVIAALVPCRFASGCEAEVARGIEGPDHVWETRQTMRYILRGIRPAELRPDLPGCLLHLGGEPMLSRLLAKRLGYPVYLYTDNHAMIRGSASAASPA